MLSEHLKLTSPGLFITATDTEVGKTVTTCAIAAALRVQTGKRVSVCKPYASACRREREGLVCGDAEALAHFADCELPLDVINPMRFAKPLAPGAAIEQGEAAGDIERLVHCLQQLDDAGDFMLVEGVGGLLVPLDDGSPCHTVLDLIRALDYPVAVVCRAGLGTLNHTALTVSALKAAGCKVAGLIINGYVPDPSDPVAAAGRDSAIANDELKQRLDEDVSMPSNRSWLSRMNNMPVLATFAKCDRAKVRPEQGVLPVEILEAAAATNWKNVMRPPR